MKGLKRAAIMVSLLTNFYGNAQVGFGIRAGLVQSMPLVLRDSFGGSPSYFGRMNLYIPVTQKLLFAGGIHYSTVRIDHKLESYALHWQTLGINIGTEWSHSKFGKTTFYTGLSADFILSSGKKVLSGASSSGTSFVEFNNKQKVIPSIELGINFNPRPLLHLIISAHQPIPQSVYNKKPTILGGFSLGLEYRLNSRQLKEWQTDTTPSDEKKFSNNLYRGILYFVLEGTDSSNRVLRKAVESQYKFSKVGFIDQKKFLVVLDSINQLPDSNQIFIAKTGSFVYNVGRAATNGVIIYNYKMENPMAGHPLFIRNISGDVFFEDPLVVNKMIKKLNAGLFKLYNMYVK